MSGKDELYDRAVDLVADGQLDDAIAVYKEAIALDPDFTDAIHGLAMAYADKGMFDEAITHGRRLVELTRDYYAIDAATTDVYYFGEEVDVYKNGKVVSHEGSWLSGEKAARFGLMMPGAPKSSGVLPALVLEMPRRNSTNWEIAGTGLPQVEVAGLTIVPSARKLYAATHGRSAWQMTLP